ncbi:MAG: DUF11 domain-containing protein, partial [Chloroflexi bacterium]|nr:DUF11 domain-containing protein [Chloroflexota bacterium]
VILTDTLGAGLRYYASTITATRGSVAGVIPDVSPDERLITWTLHEVASGAQVTIKFVAEVVDCEDLTNEFSGWQSCQGHTCLHVGPKTSYVLLPSTVLINTNNALSPLANCFTRTITATVKNAGLMSVYSATVTENLPPGMFYETGSTRYVVGAGATPPPSGWVAGGEPAGAPLGPLMWSSDQITNLAHLYPNETVWIRFDVRADCDFEGGNITIQASYEDVCGDPQTSSASHFAMTADPPEMAAQKVGRNITTGSGWGDITYAEPGNTVQWRITVNNDGGSDAPLTTITDTLPSNTSYVSAYPAPTSQSGGVVVWDIGTLTAHTSRVFTVTATVNMSECTSADTTNVVTATWGCPSPVCRRIATTQASLRTRPLLYPSIITDLPPATLHQCGGVITATLNNAGLSAYDVTMTDTLPLGFVYSGTVGYSTAPSGTVDLGQAVVYTWAVLPTGSTYVAFEVVNDAAGGWCAAPSGSNVITVTYDDAGSCTDTGPYSATNARSVSVATPALEVSKLPEQQIADVGDVVTWTIVVSNTGTGVADNLIVTDVVASNYDSDSITATIGSDGSPPIVVTSTNTITWTPDPILVGGVWTATVSAELVSAGVNRNVVTVTTYCDTGCAAATGGDTAYVTLLETFEKNPPIQTGTIGSLVVFGLAISLSDSDALYEGLTLTDTLPAGLGYVSSWLSATYDIDGTQGGSGNIISATPTITPGWLQSGDVIWQLGDLSGTVQINGVITAVIQDDPAAYDGARLVNDLRMTYTDDTRPYIYTDTADVDVLEPLLHIGKSYVTPEGCGATLFQDNFNDGDAAGWDEQIGGWSVVDGVYQNSGNGSNRRSFAGQYSWTDYSYSAMIRSSDNDTIGLIFRAQSVDTTSYYRFVWNLETGYRRLERVVSDSATTLAGDSVTYEPGRWYHVEIRA